jgi:polysaccharide export outer membrane protein
MTTQTKFRSFKYFQLTAVMLVIVLPVAAQNGSSKHTAGPRSQPATMQIAKAANEANVSTSGSTTGKPHDPSYVIGADDVLAINVWKEAEVSKTVPVRSDGKISIPLAGELQAAGLTPKQLEAEISQKLSSYISEPDVTVIVQEIKSQKFNILGQVTRPGSYLLTNSTTVLDAIAIAGGFRDFAKQKSIYVLRTKADGSQERLPFNYKQVIKGEKESQNVKLQPHDTVVIP